MSILSLARTHAFCSSACKIVVFVIINNGMGHLPVLLSSHFAKKGGM